MQGQDACAQCWARNFRGQRQKQTGVQNAIMGYLLTNGYAGSIIRPCPDSFRILVKGDKKTEESVRNGIEPLAKGYSLYIMPYNY